MGTLSRIGFSLLLLLLCSFSKQEFALFYDVYVQDVHNTLSPPPPSPPPLTAIQKFTQQGFILWLSPVSAEESDLATYYKQVRTFCSNYNITKIIWYIAYTSSAEAAFYDPASTDPNSFVGLLNNPATTLPSPTQIEFLFDCASMGFNNMGSPPVPTYAGISPSPYTPYPPTNPVHSSPLLPYYMMKAGQQMGYPWCANLYNCLWLAADLYAKITNKRLISGVTLDPEDNCYEPDDKEDYTPYLNSKDALQAIVNYMDEFSSVNVSFQPLKRGMTFDGSAKVQIFGNRSLIPITDTLLVSDTDGIQNFYNGTTVPNTAPWTRPDPTAPFLDHVYPQLYNLISPYIFTLNQTAAGPTTAGLNFLQLLSLTPYCPGVVHGQTPSPTATLSTISFSTSSTTITGSDTAFTTAFVEDVNSNSPIGYLDNAGNQQCVVPNSDSRYPDTPTGVACQGKVQTVTTDTALTLNGAPSTTQNNVKWLYVENEINYREYYVTSAMISGIYPMFSGETSFFGGWTLDQFMDFVSSFYGQGQTYSLFYQQPPAAPVPMPNQFAIFTYEQITGQASGAPNPPWFPNPN